MSQEERSGCGGQADSGPTAGFHLGYRRWLDGLRGVAILLVLAFHLCVVPGGFLGVDVFFVLSGFLITSLLAEEWQRSGGINLKRFYLRRALRLLPAFLALLVAYGFSCLLLPSRHDVVVRVKEMAVAACYVANWPGLHQVYMPTLGHAWSLSLEEQFYLLWPLLLYGLFRLNLSRRHILLLVGGGILGSAVLRIGLYAFHSHPDVDKPARMMRLYMGLDTRADTLLVGCLVGLVTAWDLWPRLCRFVVGTRAAAAVCVVVLAYFVAHKTYQQSQFYCGVFTAVALMVAVILVSLLSGPTRFARRILECAPLVGIGRISYGLYLFHWPILRWLQTRLGTHITVRLMGLMLGLSFAAALLSYFAIEKPCLRLKRRFRPEVPARRAVPAPCRLI